MARLRSNNSFGTITNNPLAIGGTTLNSAGLANLVAVTGTDVAVITLDPNRVNGAPEIVYVTAHTALATSATILRAQEGTSARSHPSGTFWVHAATALDLERVWDPPACRAYHSTTQSVGDGAEIIVLFNSERYDTDTMHSMSVNTGRITINTAGIYLFTFHGQLPALTTYSQVYSAIRVDGTTVIAYDKITPTAFLTGPLFQNTTVYKLSVGQYAEALVFQDNTSGTAQNLTNGANFSPEFSATWIGSGD